MNIKKTIISAVFALTTVATVSALAAGSAYAQVYAPVAGTLGVGSSGQNVINLQTFLASNHDMYPQGTISGYFGAYTRAAVMQFQLAYGLPMVGWVGPLTRAKMNEVINAGYGIDVYSPAIFNVAVQKTNTSAGVSWSTTESAKGKVYYSTSPLVSVEAVGNFTEPTVIGASSMLAINSQSSQSISIPNLQPNTTYYYMVMATDPSGNTAVTNMASFTTNP